MTLSGNVPDESTEASLLPTEAVFSTLAVRIASIIAAHSQHMFIK